MVTGDSTTVVAFAQTGGTGSVTGLGSAAAVAGIASRTVTGNLAGPVTITASASGLVSDATTFTVVEAAAPIPTLSEGAFVLLALLLAGMSIRAITRRAGKPKHF